MSLNIAIQWQIQDFPLGGGYRPIGGVPTSTVYTFQWKHVKTKEMDPVGGGMHQQHPPGSANAITQ